MIKTGILLTLFSIFTIGSLLSIPSAGREREVRTDWTWFFSQLLVAVGFFFLAIYPEESGNPFLFTTTRAFFFSGTLLGISSFHVFFKGTHLPARWWLPAILSIPVIFILVFFNKTRETFFVIYIVYLILFFLFIRALLFRFDKKNPYPRAQILLIAAAGSFLFFLTIRLLIHSLVDSTSPVIASPLNVFFAIVSIVSFSILIFGNRNMRSAYLNMELIQKQQKLEFQIDARDRFFNILAHDIRGPVGTLKSGLQLLQEIEEQSSKEENGNLEIIKAMHESATDTVNLIEKLLLWARMQRGKQQFMFGPLNLSSIVDGELAQIRKEVDRTDIVFHYHNPGNVLIHGDEKTVGFLVQNLLSNAYRFSSDGSTIHVEIKTNTGKPALVVKNRGTPIPAKELGNLEEGVPLESRFDRAGKKGAGLGLLLSTLFARENGGKLEIIQDGVDEILILVEFASPEPSSFAGFEPEPGDQTES